MAQIDVQLALVKLCKPFARPKQVAHKDIELIETSLEETRLPAVNCAVYLGEMTGADVHDGSQEIFSLRGAS